MKLAAMMMAAWLAGVGLPLDDLPAYQAALRSPADDAREVPFRELWNHPDAHRGRAVTLRGTVARSFRAGASGELPARVEAWIAVPSGDLVCVVFPDDGIAELPNAEVAFRGTSLGKISYASGDVTRLAPLIVGPGPPMRVEAAASKRGGSIASTDLLFGIIVATAVVMLLFRVRLRKPPARRVDAGPPPEFLDAPTDVSFDEGHADAS